MKPTRVLPVVLLIITFFSLSVYADNNSEPVLSPFVDFENWNIDETGMYTNGADISNTLERYGILDDVLTAIDDDELPGFYACTAEISGYSVKDKKIAVLLLKQGHLHIYILFSNNGNVWKADGLTYQRERNEPEYRVEISDDGSCYWLVLKHEANHGTGIGIFDEVWINPDGSVAAQYTVSGWVYFFPENINSAWAEYSATPTYDGNFIISLAYDISFHFGYKEKFQSVYSPVIREYWTYDMQKSAFKFISSEPELPAEFNDDSDGISKDFGIIGRYYRYYKSRLNDRTISALEDWEKLME